MDEEQIKKEIDRLKQKTVLAKRERRYLAKLENKLKPQKDITLPKLKGFFIKVLLTLVVFGVLGGLIWYIKTRPNLPPIDLEGHIEQNPPSHILDKEMLDVVQKHMLEHADGEAENGKGIIIQYNCKKFDCEKDLIDKLKALVKKYPQNVYLAPGNYDGKVILTRLGERKILTSYNESQIVDFITKR